MNVFVEAEELKRIVREAVREELGSASSVQTPTLNTEQAAEVLEVTSQTIERWARLGKLHGERRGRQWRFTRADLDAYRTGGPVGLLAKQMLREMFGNAAKKTE